MTNEKPMDRRVLLSTLWIFAMFNYIYADIFNLFFNPAVHAGAPAITPGAALFFAAAMETAIAMVILSRVLKRGANRWANIAAGIFHTGLVAYSLFGEAPMPFYVFFALVEMACTLLIVWLAIRWKPAKESADR
jgi:Family of unknown function (DUF6326)